MARQYRSPNRKHERQCFYKYVSAKVAKIVLSTRKLRWSSPLLFNDPFDVTQELRLDFDEHALNVAMTERVASIIEHGDVAQSVKHPIAAVILGIAIRAAPNIRQAIARDLRLTVGKPTQGQMQSFAALKQMWKEMVPTFRVLCLSELNDVTSMWLHYADRYQGAVLEFSAIDELDSAFLVARPVIYQDSPPSIADVSSWVTRMLSNDTSKFWDLFAEYQYVKTESWAYEREWRIVSGARAGEIGLFGDYGFGPNELTGIYFGPKCSSEDRSEILALLAHGLEHVRAYDSVLDNAKAKFTFREISRHRTTI